MHPQILLKHANDEKTEEIIKLEIEFEESLDEPKIVVMPGKINRIPTIIAITSILLLLIIFAISSTLNPPSI